MVGNSDVTLLAASARRKAGLAVSQVAMLMMCVRAGWFRDAKMFHEDAGLFFGNALQDLSDIERRSA